MYGGGLYTSTENTNKREYTKNKMGKKETQINTATLMNQIHVGTCIFIRSGIELLCKQCYTTLQINGDARMMGEH